MKKIILIIFGFAIINFLSFSPINLISCSTSNSSSNYALQGANELGNSCQGNRIAGSSNSAVANIVNILTYVAGVIILVLIIYSGYRYITSGGDSNKVNSAKNTLIGAIVGLMIIVVAQVIVHFVINAAGK